MSFSSRTFLRSAAASLAIAGLLATSAAAIPLDIRARAGQYARRAALERNSLRDQPETEAPEAADEIPEDAEVLDDEVAPASAQEPIGTGTRGSVRRASHDAPPVPPARRSSRPTSPMSLAQRTAFSGPIAGRTMQGGPRNSFVPAHERIAGRTFRSHDHFTSAPMADMGDMEMQEEIPMPMGKKMMAHQGQPMDGETVYEGEFYEEEMYEGGYGPRRFGRNWGDNCDPCCFRLPRIGYFEAFAGAHGFTGPLNRSTGSFGFQEGLNAGLPLFCGITAQAGINATQSNFQGAPFTPDDRTQMFVTVGGFRRVDLGLQVGVAVDYLHDDWDYNVDLSQLRGELGWMMPCGNELGFWFTVGLDQTTTDAQVPFFGNNSVAFREGSLEVEPVDIYAFYYRRQLSCGGEGRLFGGFTDDSRGLLGANMRLPLNPCWQFSTDFLYVVASEDADFGFNDESWNVSFNFVWTPCGQGWGGCQNYCRPLLDVANNGSFLTRLR